MKTEKQTTTAKKSLNQIVSCKIQANKDLKSGKQTKFLYAVKRTLDYINQEHYFEKYNAGLAKVNQEIQDIQNRHQAVDEDDFLLWMDDKATVRKFTKEGEKSCRKDIAAANLKWEKEMEKMFEAKEHDVQVHECPLEFIPKNLTFDQVDAYRGFVIPENFEPTFED